jgi:acetyl-CoA C-acetyltransferase
VGTPVIVDAVRTPIGKRNGHLSGLHPSALLGQTYQALLGRNGVEPRAVDQVIGACVTQVGEQGFNVTRTAWLAARLPYEVPGITVDCQCGSAQHANHLVHSMIAAGEIGIGIACGVEMMSRVPIGANTRNGPGRPRPADFPWDMPDQYVGAERIAAHYGLTREHLDAFALASHEKALRAAAEGRFAREIVAIQAPAPEGSGEEETVVTHDQGPRQTTAERLACLKSTIPDGLHTAASSCQISDGASAVLWMDADRARALGLRPRARIVAQAIVGSDPYFHIGGPIDATAAVLRKSGMTIGDIDLFEINEAFAAVVLAWARTYSPDTCRVNVNGGAIALGHPMGATGGRLLATAMHELERSNRSTALVAMCCGGALATATIIERI